MTEPCVPALPTTGRVIPGHLPPFPNRRRNNAEWLALAKRQGYWPLIHAMEAVIIQAAVRATGGNRSAASRLINLDRVTLIRKLREYRLRVPPGNRGAPRKETA